jgi:phage major head subunit gpT-like protein
MGQLSVFDDRNVIGSFRKAYQDGIDGSWASTLSYSMTSDKETETFRWLGAAPALREWQGGRLMQVPGRYTTSITHKKYEATMRFDVDDIRRTMKSGNQIPTVIAEMAGKAARHPEVLVSTLVTDGDTSTSGLAYDGQNFFSASHSEGSSGTQKNDLTATEVPAADVTTATAPTATEWANTLIQTIGYMYGWVDDQGDPINGDARNFVVMVGTASLYGGLVQAIGLNSLASGADNPLVGMKSQLGISITPIFNPRRSAATSEFDIFRSDGNVKPFIHSVEVPLTTEVIGAGSETAFTEDAYKFGLKIIEGATYGYWQHAAEVTFS